MKEIKSELFFNNPLIMKNEYNVCFKVDFRETIISKEYMVNLKTDNGLNVDGLILVKNNNIFDCLVAFSFNIYETLSDNKVITDSIKRLILNRLNEYEKKQYLLIHL